MKIKHLFLGSLLLGLMVSCKEDIVPDGGGQILENETTTFVRVSILDATGGTRAGAAPGYELGTASESKINSVLLTFFDAGRNYVGKTKVDLNEKEEDVKVPGEDFTVERIRTFVAQVDLPENINYPKYVVAYVNPTSANGDLATEKLEDAMKFLRSRSEVSHEGARTMNNSVYFDENTGFTRFATEVDFKTQFFESKDEALASNAPTIDITVERMEAKVRLSTPLADMNVVGYESNSGVDDNVYTLTFVPEMWYVNGTEKRSFLLKNFRTDRFNYTAHMSETDYGFNLTGLQDAFKKSGWSDAPAFNDFTNKRSYWAIDPTYFMENEGEGDYYPDISFDVKYGPSVNLKGKTYPLEYRSYENVRDEYKNRNNKNVVFNSNGRSHEYVLENTMSINTLRSLDAKAAMTSVVLLGHYVIKNKAGQEVFNGGLDSYANKSFYIRHEASFGTGEDSQATKTMVLIDDKAAINFFMERSGSTLFIPEKDDKGNLIENSYVPLRAAHLSTTTSGGINYGVSHNDFELVYPGTDVTNGKKQSEQWRTLGIKGKLGEFNDNLYVYDYTMNEGNGGYKKLNQLTAEEYETFRDRMYSSFGVIEKFESGKAFFNVPLRHIWADLSSTSNEFKTEGLKLGQYGVVRNHVYDLEIGKITGLGIGIGDIKQPIVPPTENDQYFISTRLNILQWRLVKQSVDL